MKQTIHIISIFRPHTPAAIPLYQSHIRAGFPSPAEDYIEKTLDFNEYLVKHPAATFTVKVAGNSMTGAGIHNGDLLIVDRAITPAHNRIVIAVLDGELTVKRLVRQGQKVFLAAENPEYSPIEVPSESNFEIWGVVTNVIHPVS